MPPRPGILEQVQNRRELYRTTGKDSEWLAKCAHFQRSEQNLGGCILLFQVLHEVIGLFEKRGPVMGPRMMNGI